MNSGQRIAVTGANGFLGSSLCRIAADSGHEVIAVVRRPCNLPGAKQVILAPLTDSEALAEAFRECTAVVHTAGLAHVFGSAAADTKAFHTVNVLGTQAVSQASRDAKVPRLILASSVSVYGGSDDKSSDESSPLSPRTPYARSKLEAEQAAAEVFTGYGYLTTLRFATLYGEGDSGNVARLVGSLHQKRFVWPGPGLNHKSLIYKEDAARACLAAVREGGEGIYNVSAKPVTMRQIVQAICLALDRPMPRAHVPRLLLEAGRAFASHFRALRPLEWQIHSFLKDDIYPADRFCTRFGWEPEVILEEGIERQVRSQA